MTITESPGAAECHDILSTGAVKNAMSVDVEDYFQVSAFEPHISRESWSDLDCRVERNTNLILEMLATADAKATFFFLGWIAERYPSLLRAVSSQGHEIASHGYSHVRVGNQDRDEFLQDVDRTKKLLEDLTGHEVRGYRAASFSIGPHTPWAYDVLASVGYRYSSSIFPIRHDRYGLRDAPRFPHQAQGANLVELPVTTVEWRNIRLPCGGGGYFRLLPYRLTSWGIRRVNEADGQPSIFYFHPWELDADQPRVPGVDPRTRFRHYVNLSGYESKLRRLLKEFKWTSIADAFHGSIR